MPPNFSSDAKVKMRRRARAVRANIPNENRQQAAKQVARLGLGFLSMPSALIAGYFPVRNEFDCMPLLEGLEAAGWRLALPVIREDALLDFRTWQFGAPLEPGPFDIPQPPLAPPVTPDVLLVPLLAFDAQGNRLGYGGGHYDRTLAKLRAGHCSIAIGLAFDEQEMPAIAVEPYDQRLNWILTPSGARAMQIP